MTKEGERLQKLSEAILASYFKSPHLKMEVSLIDKATMRKLNRTFRGLDKPTDVLSFQTPADFPLINKKERMIGEVFLCPSYIKEHPISIDHLLVHGLLHLLGFDHVKEHARMRMQTLESKILAWLKNKY